MTTEDFKKLQDLLDKKLVYTHENLPTKLLEYPTIHQTLIKVLTDITKEKNDLEAKRLEIYGNLYRHFKFESEYRWENKSEIESQIFADKKYLTIAKEIEELEVQSLYVGKTVDGMRSLSYTARSYIDYQKLINGVL